MRRVMYVINKDKWFIRIRAFGRSIYVDWNILFVKGLNISIYK